jgi:hypothetical protein
MRGPLKGDTGVMKVAIAIAISYLVTGLHYVLRDFSRPAFSPERPAYVREASIGVILLTIITWPFPSIFVLHFTRGHAPQAVFSLLLFPILSWILWYIVAAI